MSPSRIKVLIILANLHQGGTQRHVSYLLDRIDKSRFDVHVGYFIDTEIFYHDLAVDPKISHVFGSGKSVTPRSFYSLIRAIKKLKPDILHCYMQSANIITGFAHYFSPKIPMIFSVGMTQQPAWHYWFYRLLRKRPTLTICNSKRIRKELTERAGLPEDKVRVLYNPLDTDRFHPFEAKEKEQARGQFGFERGSLVFATIGRISHQKNKWGTVRALGILKGKGQLPKGFKMLFIGKRHSAAYDRELRRMIRDAGLEENCVLREPLENILSLYNAVDAVFLPSHHEGLCNVAIECQASGTPVALSLESDNDQLIRDGETGFSFSIASDEEIAEGLKRLIDLCGNPEKKAALTFQAREEVRKKFSLKEAIELREAMYESLMK